MPARTGPSLKLLLACAVPIVVALALLPRVIDLYQTELLIYGFTFAIAALGFNLLLGYTGLLSFGHSAYFGVGAYAVAFIVRDLGVHSMELCILGGLGSLEGALVGALIVSFVRTAGVQFFPEIELAVLYLIAAAVLLIRPTGLFGRA